ncbi:MAG: mandelate racemase/muconate lactonizing enzyme family protein [Chloroflexi bacterium]|nr:mandelate racemase/muconate lactonizing enzyme family protein [Chloroflexota bacterium]
MKITDVETIVLEKQLPAPIANSKDARARYRTAIVRVRTDEGYFGLGEAFTDAGAVAGVVNGLKPRIVGLDPFAIELVWHRCFHGLARYDAHGLPVAVLSAIDMALWDLKGKVLQVPVYELLGGRIRDRVKAYASDLHWQEDPTAMAREAARFVEQGFKIVKTHVGRDPEDDIRRVRALREAIGPATGLMVDINTAYDRPTAIQFGRRIVDLDVFWYEEPLPPFDLAGHRLVRENTGLLIATGENEYTKYGFKSLFEANAVDYAMPDVARCGGLTETKKICALAQAHNITVSPHNYSSGVCLAATLHLMMSTPGTELLEYDTADASISREFFLEPPEVKDGYVSLPETPGLGVILSDALIEKYGV